MFKGSNGNEIKRLKAIIRDGINIIEFNHTKMLPHELIR